MDSTDAVAASSDDVPQQGTKPSGLAGPAPQTPQEWEDDSYIMKKENMMGHVIIFNTHRLDEENFAEYGLQERFGTDTDAKNMENLFSTMGFKVTVVTDATKAEMMQIMDKESQTDHSSNNAFVCILLSHAEGERVVYAKDGIVWVDHLMAKVNGENCPSLAGKPKLFFFQGCWCDWDPEWEDPHAYDETEPARDYPEILPVEADFFLFETQIPGIYAWKNDKSKGSWFIQAIYDEFSSNWKKKDVNSMCTKVMANVNKLCEKEDPTEWQLPRIFSSLRKELNFFG